MTVAATSLSLGSAFAAGFAFYVNPTIADILGAYAAIILSAVAGAGWALTRSERTRTTREAVGYVVLLIMTSTVVTAEAADMAHTYLLAVDTRGILAPMALFIAAVGDEWPALVRWGVRMVLRKRDSQEEERQ